MKTKVIVGIICALFAIGLLVLTGFGYGMYISIVMAAFSVLCVHEILGVAGCKNKVLTYVSMVFAGGLSLWLGFDLQEKIPFSNTFLYMIYCLAVLILMLKMYDKTRFEHVVMALFCSAAIPYSVNTLILVSKFSEEYPELFCKSNCVFLCLMGMYCWLCDAISMFAGKAFGKHKMSPKISPNKTYEGAIGGILGTTLISMITYFVFTHYFTTDTIKWWMVLIGVPVVSVMGIFGDLAASVIKRNYGVKDFGTLFPEHGGAMDRIDSYLFSMPSVYLICKFFAEIL